MIHTYLSDAAKWSGAEFFDQDTHFSGDEYLAFIQKEPAAEKWFKRWITGDSYINNRENYVYGCRIYHPQNSVLCLMSYGLLKK
jgi:hypothetical protein